jgi:hypothetical protein
LEAGPIRTGAGHCFVTVDVILEDQPSIPTGMLAALSDLIDDAGGTLAIGRKSSVDGTAELTH